MGYFDDEKKVDEYIKLAEGYDGRELMPILTRHVREGASVLELGMGPGKDYEILSEHFQVTGSDSSLVFLDRYRRIDPSADLVLLDAVNMEIDRRFDCIYSNKVLHHLSRAELVDSLARQWHVLNDAGILFHTLWHGESEEMMDGLRFVYYTETSFARALGPGYEVVESGRYTEMEEDDSIYCVVKKLPA
jgi:trans-aconitate methyltransferase